LNQGEEVDQAQGQTKGVYILEIDKILSVSTGNITYEDTQELEKEQGFTVAEYNEGFFLYTSLSYEYYGVYSEAFHNIILLARELNCRFICFDADADPIPGLPTFDW
jgi:hypothetical protein